MSIISIKNSSGKPLDLPFKALLYLLDNALMICPHCEEIQTFKGTDNGIGICKHCEACFLYSDPDNAVLGPDGTELTTIDIEL